MTVPTSLDERFRAAAAAEGLLDAGYDVLDSPVGPLFVAATPRGVCRISYDADVDRQEARLAQVYGLRVLRAPRADRRGEARARRLLRGPPDELRPRPRPRGVAPFHREVLAELARVPFGQTTTYGTLARQAGRPRAARAVGTVMNRNPIPIVLPCHRVVGANGSLTGYAGGLDVKEALLRLEGAIL